MLHELPAYRARVDRLVRAEDITMVLAVRAHDENPWAIERLRWHATTYSPRPAIHVLDFGSAEPHRSRVEATCREHGLGYRYVHDTDTFSLARARNLAFADVKTTYVFFNDVDCFAVRDLFARLADTANAMRLGAAPDQMINLPVYHLDEAHTARLQSIEDPQQRSVELHRIGMDAALRDFGEVSEFIAPYSNFFLCHRDFFDLVGGYDERFRGHGSEDFEFLLRFSIQAGLPLPVDPGKDQYGPLRDEFFGVKPYRGFRRLFELLAFPTELEGLRVFHFYHPKPQAQAGGWYQNNDWKRERFNQAIKPYLDAPSGLLERDWLARAKTCLVLIKNEDHVGFFLPLRLAGYRLVTLPLSEPAELARVVDRITAREFDAVAIFNPFMKSHTDLRPYFELAKSHGARPIVVERGALPESWYYARGISYEDRDFLDLDVSTLALSADEVALAGEYRVELRKGRSALEHQQSPDETASRVHVYTRTSMRRVLIPLQLDDDVAVTRFTDGYPSYPEYKQELIDGMARHPDVLFLVKPHPLAKTQLDVRAPNVVMLTDGENIHALMDAVDAVICYNSGVGLLAALQGKRIVTFGNAFYNRPEIGRRARTLDEALAEAFDRAGHDASPEVLDRLTAWLLFRKYSFFKAESVIRDFGERRSHGYRDLRGYLINLPDDGVTWSWLRAAVDRRLGMRSYAAGRLGLGVAVDGARNKPKAIRKVSSTNPLSRKLRKLARDPGRFFADARSPWLRMVGARVFTERD